MQLSPTLPRISRLAGPPRYRFAGPPTDRGPVSWMTGTLLAEIAKFLSGASARWVDCQPDTCQRIYFANHTSHLDALVVWDSLPMELRNIRAQWRLKTIGTKGRSGATWRRKCLMRSCSIVPKLR